jgi:molecular chaperone GrpE
MLNVETIMSDKKNNNDSSELNDLLNKLDLQNDPDLVDDQEEKPSLGHPSYTELEEQLTLAEQKAHEHWEKLERALAEVENIRRRADRDVTNAHRYSLEKFGNALLPVVDSLEQALAITAKDANPAAHEGLELTMKLFIDVLKKFEIHQIDPIGEIFDPQQHEAMSAQVSQDAAPNTVLAVFQKGYVLHGRLIRPARVVVSKE